MCKGHREVPPTFRGPADFDPSEKSVRRWIYLVDFKTDFGDSQQITFEHGNQYTKRGVPDENTPKFTLAEAGIEAVGKHGGDRSIRHTYNQVDNINLKANKLSSTSRERLLAASNAMRLRLLRRS